MKRGQRTYLYILVMGGIGIFFMYMTLSMIFPEVTPPEVTKEGLAGAAPVTAPSPVESEGTREPDQVVDLGRINPAPSPAGPSRTPDELAPSSTSQDPELHPPTETQEMTYPRIVSDSVVEIQAGVHVSFSEEKLVIEGMVAIDHGVIELLMSSGAGYDHETIVTCQFDPFKVYLCLLLMGMREGKGVRLPGEAADLSGDRVKITAEWSEDGKTISVPAEELVWNAAKDMAMEQSGWVFVGSHIFRLTDPDIGGETGQQVFFCERDPRFVTTWRHPAAVFDNPLPDAWDDGVYYANPHVVPPRGTKMRMTIERAPKK